MLHLEFFGLALIAARLRATQRFSPAASVEILTDRAPL